MTDLTPSVSSILVQAHSSSPISPGSAKLSQSLDSFLKEANQINKSISSLHCYLKSIRQPYLFSAPPPRRTQHFRLNIVATEQLPAGIPTHLDDRQRAAIDTKTSSVLREINGNITNLSSAVSLQYDTATKVLEKKYGKPTGMLWKWAAGDGDTPDAGKSHKQIEEEGCAKTTRSFRDGVLWYLNKKLESAVGTQQEMAEVRLERERQRQLSVLYDKSNSDVRFNQSQLLNGDEYGNVDLRGHDKYNSAMDKYTASDKELSPEQMQLFEEENQGLFQHLNDQLAKVTQAEKSLIEISTLQQTLVSHLSVQGDMIEQLVEDASNTDENVKRGNKELKRASERSSIVKAVFWGTASLCSFLVVWDLIF